MSSMPMEPVGTQEVEKDSTASTSQEHGASSDEGPVDVIAIPANRALVYWPHVKPFLEAAFTQFPGEADETSVLRNLAVGRWVLWVAWDGHPVGGFITELETYINFGAVRIVALGGKDFESWRIETDKVLDKFARFHGCSRIEFYGRKGWERRLPNYTVNRIMMVRQV